MFKSFSLYTLRILVMNCSMLFLCRVFCPVEKIIARLFLEKAPLV